MNKKIPKINIKKLRYDLNLYFFDKLNWGIDKLILSNYIINKMGGMINEQIEIFNSNIN